MSREQSTRTTSSSSKVHSTKEDRRGHEHLAGCLGGVMKVSKQVSNCFLILQRTTNREIVVY